MGTILGYLDFKIEIIHILQRLSHSSRAFIWNADGLPGFLVETDKVMWILEKAEKTQKIVQLSKWQHHDMDKIKGDI